MLVGASPRRVAIIGGVRIPFARGNGAYAQVGNQEMLTARCARLVERYRLQGQRLGDVAAGAVMKHSSQWNLPASRCSAADWPRKRPASTCSAPAARVWRRRSRRQQDRARTDRLRDRRGVDTVSDPPVVFPKSFQQLLLKSYRGKSPRASGSAPGSACARGISSRCCRASRSRAPDLSMGESTELMVKTWGISRAEQDQLALESHHKAAAAYAAGFYKDLVQPYLGLAQDNNIRADTSLEKLAQAAPGIRYLGAGTLTAGNSTPMTDGASAVLLASEAWARERNLPVLAFLTYGKVAAVDFVDKKEGLLMAPAYAVPRMLGDAQLTLQDFDFYEIHEAFAGQVLCTLKAWTDRGRFAATSSVCRTLLGAIDRAKLNVKGGSLAIGHPFAATGTRIVATLAKILDEAKAKRGLISICTAGGMGVTAIVER